MPVHALTTTRSNDPEEQHFTFEDTWILESTLLVLNENLTLRIEEDSQMGSWDVILLDKNDDLSAYRQPLRMGLPNIKDAKHYAVEWAKDRGHIPQDFQVVI